MVLLFSSTINEYFGVIICSTSLVEIFLIEEIKNAPKLIKIRNADINRIEVKVFNIFLIFFIEVDLIDDI